MSTASLSNLRNYIVVARAEGLRLGTISETFIHPSSRKLSAIAVKGGLADAERYVHLDDIELIGEDVVLVANVAAAKADLGQVEEVGRAFNDLRTMPVGTAGGVVLGKLADIDVDAEDGLVARMFLADGRAVNVEPEEVTFGRDQIVLPAGSEDRISEPDEERRGFLAKLFSQETVDEVTGTLRRAFRSSDKSDEAVEADKAGSGSGSGEVREPRENTTD